MWRQRRAAIHALFQREWRWAGNAVANGAVLTRNGPFSRSSELAVRWKRLDFSRF